MDEEISVVVLEEIEDEAILAFGIDEPICEEGWLVMLTLPCRPPNLPPPSPCAVMHHLLVKLQNYKNN